MMVCRPRDTIAWRFGATIAAAIALTSVLIALFVTFGGVWAQPPPDLRSLLEGAKAVTDIIDAAPTPIRPRLAAAAKAETYSLRWYAKDSDAVRWLDSVHDSRLQTTEPDFVKELEQLRRPFIVTDPSFPGSDRRNSPLHLSHDPDTHYLAVTLTDGSWLVFVGSNRNWGLSIGARMAVKFILFLIVATAICAVATRQISSPIRKFAKAVHAAGVNPNAAPIAEAGPQELREVIAAFNGMQAKIAAFVTYRTAMLAAISHDLRTPLTRIRLRGEYIADPVQRERLFGDVLEMQAMVDGALAFFRGDADEEPVRTFDLSDLLQSIADGFADQGIDVGHSETERVIYVGRAIAIKRAVTNLVENAVKYGALPSMTLMAGATQITVTVRDHGVGIPADALERVFEPFYRLDKSRHKATGGVGLGLTAARAVIRGHGGDITLRNHPDGGLEATVTLPRVGTPA
jgi:two-component system osmolarity sensor histidine kinase EnvZ